MSMSGEPIPIRLLCPECFCLHVDEGEFATKPHHTHACQNCGEVWRPAIVPTVGVRFLPGFKDDSPDTSPLCPHKDVREILDEGRANDAGISSRHQCFDCGEVL